MPEKIFSLEICGLTRHLPIVALGTKTKAAAFNILGDGELAEAAAAELARKLRPFDFETLVGPEVRALPLLQTLTRVLEVLRYVVLRKKVYDYMIRPHQNEREPKLVIDHRDAEFLQGKRVAVIDDFVATGQTLQSAGELIEQSGGEVVVNAVIFKQGASPIKGLANLLYLGELPIFRNI